MPTLIERAAEHIKPPAVAVDQIIRLDHPALTPRDVAAFERLKLLRSSYISLGKGRESNGVARSMIVLWHTCLQTATTEELAATMPVPLDIVLE